MITKTFQFVWKALGRLLVLVICLGLLFTVYKANQPMSVPDAPQGMTYFEFIQDRIDAAKAVEPSRCGWGMMLSLATLGPIYSVIYTAIAIHPDGQLAKMTASDPDIPKGVERPIGTKSQESGGKL